MRRIGILSIVVLLCVLSVACGSIFSRSPPTAENVKQAKDKLFDSAGVPNSKAGELYHEAAAKADRFSGEMNARKHEALAAAARLSKNVDNAVDYTAPKVEEMVDKAKEWTEAMGEKAREAKEEAMDRAGVPRTKIGELYHQGAAKVDDMMGDSLNARRHEALVAAKRINDDPTDVVHNVEPLAKGVFGKLKEWTGKAQDKAIDMKDEAYDRAGVPKTKIGELYHQGAAKIDQLLGDDLDARRHEALVAAKRFNDNPSDVRYNMEPVTSGVSDKLKQWSGQAQDKAIDMKDEAMDRAGVPRTKIGELYHQGAAKVDDMMGDSLNARRHEALVSAKRINDDPTDVRYNTEPVAHGVIGKLKEWTGLAHDKAQEAGDFANDKYYQAKGNAREIYHDARDNMRDSTISEDSRDFARDQYSQGKSKVGGIIQNTKETIRDLGANQHGDRFSSSDRGVMDFDKDFATDTFDYQTSQSRSPRKVSHEKSHSGIFGNKFSRSTNTSDQFHAEKSHSHVLPIVILSLLSGGLLYLFFSQNESANKARGKFYEAKGNAKELYRAGKARAGDIFEERAQEKNKELVQNELKDTVPEVNKAPLGSKYLSFPLTAGHTAGLGQSNIGVSGSVPQSGGAYAAGYHEGFRDGKDINEGHDNKPTSTSRVH